MTEKTNWKKGGVGMKKKTAVVLVLAIACFALTLSDCILRKECAHPISQ